jgi:hypothetical protein
LKFEEEQQWDTTMKEKKISCKAERRSQLVPSALPRIYSLKWNWLAVQG